MVYAILDAIRTKEVFVTLLFGEPNSEEEEEVHQI